MGNKRSWCLTLSAYTLVALAGCASNNTAEHTADTEVSMDWLPATPESIEWVAAVPKGCRSAIKMLAGCGEMDDRWVYMELYRQGLLVP